LEEKYVNNSTKMKYICKCGGTAEITYGHFSEGKRCADCAGNKKLSYKYVQNYFKEQNCELLETEYTNTRTKMKYRCKCGNESSTSFDNFRAGYRCMKCSGNERLTLEFVQQYFKEHNCELLETSYINSNTKMKYKCECGREHEMTWDNFKQGYRCRYCGFEKNEGSKVRYKDYTLPSGKVIKIQGYENMALDELVQHFSEDDLVTKRTEVPEMKYELNGKIGSYFPDIYIKSENLIIEVKSSWTYKRDLIKNIEINSLYVCGNNN
jgi:DNA-directed RNA polymerase subunit RPC12/RpoP